MSRKFKKEDGYTEKDLLHFGYDHIDTALALLKNAHYACYDSAGYLLQLGFELILKAWHLHEISYFKDVHDLNKLITELKDEGCSIDFDGNEQKTIDTISEFYNLRYPRRVEGTVEIGSEQAIEFENLLDSLWQKLPSELISAYNEIDRNRKDGRILMRKAIEH